MVGEDCKILGVDVWGYMMYTFFDMKMFERSIGITSTLRGSTCRFLIEERIWYLSKVRMFFDWRK